MIGAGIGNRYVVFLMVEPPEEFGELIALEVRGRPEKPFEQTRRVVIKSIAPEAGGDQRRVVRPDTSEMIAQRIVCRLLL